MTTSMDASLLLQSEMEHVDCTAVLLLPIIIKERYIQVTLDLGHILYVGHHLKTSRLKCRATQ